MASFLFLSGFCALVYQIGWMREFRLIFGASTAASAAVLAIFIGGLGAGGIIIGRRVDRSDRPLLLYGWMEMAIAIRDAHRGGLGAVGKCAGNACQQLADSDNGTELAVHGNS